MVRVGELLRDAGVGGGGCVVEVPADVDGEDEREEVRVAVTDGRVQRGVAVLVLHCHLRRTGWWGGPHSQGKNKAGFLAFLFLGFMYTRFRV